MVLKSREFFFRRGIDTAAYLGISKGLSAGLTHCSRHEEAAHSPGYPRMRYLKRNDHWMSAPVSVVDIESGHVIGTWESVHPSLHHPRSRRSRSHGGDGQFVLRGREFSTGRLGETLACRRPVPFGSTGASPRPVTCSLAERRQTMSGSPNCRCPACALPCSRAVRHRVAADGDRVGPPRTPWRCPHRPGLRDRTGRVHDRVPVGADLAHPVRPAGEFRLGAAPGPGLYQYGLWPHSAGAPILRGLPLP